MDHALGDKPAARRELTALTAGRVDAVLAAAYPDLTRSRVQRLIADGHVSVNTGLVRKSGRVEPGDAISLIIPETEHEQPATGLTLPVLYEDDLLLVIDKPAGLATHGAPGDKGPSVAAWFVERYPSVASAFAAERPGIVHRLDKDTSGVLLLAKAPAAQAALAAAFESRAAKKTYIALTDGVPERPRAVIDAAIARHPGDRTRMSVARGGHGRESRTEYEVVAATRDSALVVVHPETGRTHQIRVHLAAIGTPVAQDHVYGRGGEGRQLLHAWRLDVPHPRGGTLTVTAPLPADIAKAIRALGLEAAAVPYSTHIPAEVTPAES